jgi:CRISPR-associated exonuclease Cas4
MTSSEGAVDDSVQSKQSDSDFRSEDEISREQEIVETISSEVFDEWYQSREFRRNIENGTPYFNGPSNTKPASRHSPSSLLQCHRKTFYKQLNAPRENKEPTGIFWIGTHFEEDIALPFLREAVVGENQFVTNSVWVDFNVETKAGELRIKGETDPVIVNADSEPLILTEIKTKKSVGELNSPSSHHKAQAHAYMKGLTKKFDRKITDTLIIYGGRKNLDIRSFHVKFDPVFWRQTVVNWAAQHTSYRLRDELPPADPEHDWECTFCSYRERCGKGDLEYSDFGPSGLLPGVSIYPKSKVIEYLEAHEGAKLTPTLAKQYPKVAAQYQVAEWHCVACGMTFAWDRPDWDSEVSPSPLCPECKNNGTPVPLQIASTDDCHFQQEGDSDGSMV